MRRLARSVLVPLAALLLIAPGCVLRPPLEPGGETGPGTTGGGGGGGGGGGTSDGGTSDGGIPRLDGGVDGGSIQGDLRFKLVPDSPTYSSEVRQTAASVAAEAYGLASNGNAITAMTWNSVASYLLIGVKSTTAPRTYFTSVRQATADGLVTTLQALGSSGYMVSAMTYNTNDAYVLVGQKYLDANNTFTANGARVSAANLTATAQGFGTSGYVITAMTYNNTVYTLAAVKDPNGRTYLTDVRQVADTQLLATAESLGGAGYVVTAFVYTGTGFTLISQKETGSNRTFTTSGGQVSGSNLVAALNTLGNGGYVPTTVYSDDAVGGYILIGTK